MTLTGLQFATDFECRFAIANNVLWNFTQYGINVNVAAAQVTSDVTINGNVIRTEVVCVAGINMPSASFFAIAGNSVHLAVITQAQDGIIVGSGTATDGTVSGNSVYVNEPTAGHYGVKVTGDGIVVCGNRVLTNNVRGINGGAGTFVVCNKSGGGSGAATFGVVSSTDLNIT